MRQSTYTQRTGVLPQATKGPWIVVRDFFKAQFSGSMNVTGHRERLEQERNRKRKEGSGQNVMNESKELFTMPNLSMFLSAKIV